VLHTATQKYVVLLRRHSSADHTVAQTSALACARQAFEKRAFSLHMANVCLGIAMAFHMSTTHAHPANDRVDPGRAGTGRSGVHRLNPPHASLETQWSGRGSSRRCRDPVIVLQAGYQPRRYPRVAPTWHPEAHLAVWLRNLFIRRIGVFANRLPQSRKHRNRRTREPRNKQPESDNAAFYSPTVSLAKLPSLTQRDELAKVRALNSFLNASIGIHGSLHLSALNSVRPAERPHCSVADQSRSPQSPMMVSPRLDAGLSECLPCATVSPKVNGAIRDLF